MGFLCFYFKLVQNSMGLEHFHCCFELHQPLFFGLPVQVIHFHFGVLHFPLESDSQFGSHLHQPESKNLAPK